MEGTLTSTGGTESPGTNESNKASRVAKTMGWFSWSAFALFCLVFFTILKIPETRLQNYIQGTIASLLADRGITFRAKQGYISFGLGISYVMKDVSFMMPGSETPLQIDEISVSPSLASIFFGRIGASLSIRNKDSYLDGSVSMKDKAFSVSADARKFDLGRTGILPVAAGIKGSALVNGSVSMKGDLSNPSTMNGDIQLSLSKVNLDPQNIAGFNVPKISISEGTVNVQVRNGKATVKTLTLGKAGNTAEDIRGTVTGEATLARQLDASNVNLKMRFGFSESVMKAFVLLDALLGAGKQPDGMYSYQLTGPMYAPNFQPAPGGQ